MPSAPNAPSTWNQRLLLAAQRADRREIVDRADVDGAGGRDHQKRLQARRAIARNPGAQGRDVDAVRLIDLD